MIDTPMSPRQPTRRRLRWWVWVLIALPVLAFVSFTVLGFIAYVEHSLGETSPDQPFIEGRAQNPIAASPLLCAEQCFGIDSASLLAVSDEDVAPLSITHELNPVGAFEPSTVADVAPDTAERWLAVGGDEKCAFIPANAPFIAAGSEGTSTDQIAWVQTWETGDEMTDIAARTFPTADGASAFLRDLHERVAACPWQDLNTPSVGGLDTSLVQITPQAAIEVPSEVAAVGWVREGSPGPRWRSYVWDLQRGNLVVQVRVLTDGRILEQQVATFTELVAGRLGSLHVTER